MSGSYVIHGLKCSYFTGKLEAYFRVKGIPYGYVEMDSADFRACARATGVRQMPQLECPDGSWRTDTTPIIAELERTVDGPGLTPATPVAKFISLLLEDFGDEWLWRPALYYRWAFSDDADLMCKRIARSMLADMSLPFWLKAAFIKRRQKRVFLGGDGVTRETAPHVEALYLETLEALEAIFAARPFLMGARPCEADFGFMGPMFRHFSIDPTPAAIMRERGPRTLAWIARVWSTTPQDLASAAPVNEVPDDLQPLLKLASKEYLPYLAANAAACAAGDDNVQFESRGVSWSVPAAPYRAFCLSELQRAFAALNAEQQTQARNLLGGARELDEHTTSASKVDKAKPVGRLWRAS